MEDNLIAVAFGIVHIMFKNIEIEIIVQTMTTFL